MSNKSNKPVNDLVLAAKIGHPSIGKGSHNVAVAAEYKRLRRMRGSQGEVAEMIGISKVTISRRENGYVPIRPEAFAALELLAVKVMAKK